MSRLFRAGLLAAAGAALAAAQTILLQDTFTSYNPLLFSPQGYDCPTATTALSSCTAYAPIENGIVGSTTSEYLKLTSAANWQMGSIESSTQLPVGSGAFPFPVHSIPGDVTVTGHFTRTPSQSRLRIAMTNLCVS